MKTKPNKTVTAHEARVNWRDLMDGAQFQGDLVEVTRHGRPAAYVLSPADFAALVAAAKGDGQDGGDAK